MAGPEDSKSVPREGRSVAHLKATDPPAEPYASATIASLAQSSIDQPRDRSDFSPDMLFEIGLDGRFVFASQGVERIVGHSVETVTGRSFLEFMVPDDRERMLALFQKIIETGEEPDTQFGVIRSDGERLLIHSRIRIFSKGQPDQRIFVSCRDVTDESNTRAVDQKRLEYYRLLAESERPAAVFGEDGQILFMNRAFQAAAGPATHVQDLLNRIDPHSRAQLEAHRPAPQQGPSSGEFDFRFIDFEGEATWLSMEWSIRRTQDEKRVITTYFSPIAHRKRIEQALRLIVNLDPRATPIQTQEAVSALAEALKFDRLTFAEVPDTGSTTGKILAGVDLPRETADGSSIHPTSIAGETLDFEGLPDAVTASGETCVHPMGLQQLMPDLVDRIGHAYESYAGLPIRLEDGTTYAVISGYRRLGIDDLTLTRTLLDVFAERVSTAENHRRTNEELSMTQTRFNVISDHSPDLLLESDDRYKILYVSDACQTILGKPPEEFVGKNILDVIHPEDLQVAERAGEAFAEGRRDALFVSRARHANGEWRSLEARSIPYTTPDGERRSIILARDVTHRLQTEAALQANAVRIDDASRMEAVGRLAGGIAHDFNNLLTAIIGYSDLVLDAVGPDSVAYSDAHEVLRAAERAGNLTRQLLTFSRRPTPNSSSAVDLNAVIADMDRMIRRLIPENIEMVTLQSGELRPTHVGQGQLEQVLMNLVINACDAMPRGGQLTVETKPVAPAESLDLRSGRLEPGPYAVLTVRDSGSGMSDEVMERIFEPFFTTKGNTSGTGLGLATVQEIVTDSGGQIDVQSAPGTGTSFSTYFPAASLDSLAEAEQDVEDESLAAAPRGTETVLVVEDAESVRTMLARTLSRAGYKVLEAESTTAALRHCARHDGPIDLLLSDVVLPKASGVDVARRATAIRPDLKVHFMSGFPDETLEQHGLSRHQMPLLAKPFSPVAALHAIRDALDDKLKPTALERREPSSRFAD